ncbi:hypothetical protein MY10362_007089 [Beauveria mimosiformis]
MDTQLASSSINANSRRTVTPLGSLDRSMLLEAETRIRQATDQITTGVNGLTLGLHDGEESQESNACFLHLQGDTVASCSQSISDIEKTRSEFASAQKVMHPEEDYKRRSVPPCPHEPCVSLNLQAQYRWNPISNPGQQSVYIEWSTEIKSDDSRDWRDQVVEKATELVKNHPKLFCPHIRAVPARFGDISSIVRNQLTFIHDEKFEMGCFSCDQAIYFDEVDSQASGGRIRLRGWRRVRVETGSKMRGCHWKWLSNIEPDSFGLHHDSDAMNISWCHGGPACATNYGYLHYTELLFNAAQPNCEFFAAVYKEKRCVPYQPFMDIGGGRGVHDIDIKAARMQKHN